MPVLFFYQYYTCVRMWFRVCLNDCISGSYKFFSIYSEKIALLFVVAKKSLYICGVIGSDCGRMMLYGYLHRQQLRCRVIPGNWINCHLYSDSLSRMLAITPILSSRKVRGKSYLYI